MPKRMVSFRGMKFIADLHIHSHYSRATSKTLHPENLSLWAQKKGITVVGTGDFTHAGWVAELQEKLAEAETGLYRLKPDLQKAVDSQVPGPCIRSTRFLYHRVGPQIQGIPGGPLPGTGQNNNP